MSGPGERDQHGEARPETQAEPKSDGQGSPSNQGLREMQQDSFGLKEFEATFGSVENFLRAAVEAAEDPVFQSELKRLKEGTVTLASKFQKFNEQGLARHGAELGNAQRWKELAAKDPQELQRQWEEAIRACNRAKNRVCDIESHRPPENEERDSLLLQIKILNPSYKWPQVTKEYERQTGESIDVKVAQSAYTRYIEDLRLSLEIILSPLPKLPGPAPQHKTP